MKCLSKDRQKYPLFFVYKSPHIMEIWRVKEDIAEFRKIKQGRWTRSFWRKEIVNSWQRGDVEFSKVSGTEIGTSTRHISHAEASLLI